MEAVILAGGFATRLYPLTEHQAKPLIEIGGKPAIFHILERLFALREHGLTRVLVVSNERFAQDFREALAGPHPVPVDVVSNGVLALDDKLGAIGDMAVGSRAVSPGSPFWILAGDNLFDFDLSLMVESFERRDQAPHMLAIRLPRLEDTVLHNNLEVDQDGRLLRFEEKPARPFSTLVGTCMYLFPNSVATDLSMYLTAGKDPDKAGFFIKWLAKRQPVYTLEPPGTWFDVGSLEEIRAADAFFANK